MSAGERMLQLLKDNVEKLVSREELAAVAGVHDWSRAIRQLRQDGWDIETIRGEDGGYILKSLIKEDSGKERTHISQKLRYKILHRDESTCQKCGRGVADKVKLHIDHKIPVEWGGSTDLDNLWTLCDVCNGGKKDWFSDEDAEQMKEIMALESGTQRLIRLFELNPNKFIPSAKIAIISRIQDWPRSLRMVRSKHDLNLVYTLQNGEQGYIYETE